MQESSKIHSTEYTDLNPVVGWFIILRWIAGAGVLIALCIAYLILKYDLHYPVLFSAVFLLFGLNLFFSYTYFVLKKRNLLRRELWIFFNLQISFDYIFLLIFVFFTGFLENPFLYYFVFHIMITAFVFPDFMVFLYAGILSLILTLVGLFEYLHIVPHFTLSPAFSSISYSNLIFIRLFGICSTLIITAYLITRIKYYIEERGKKVEFELTRFKNIDKIKSNFILQVTHELRGPVAAIKGYHEMILKGITGETNPKTTTTLEKADHRTRNLLTIIDEMIDFAFLKSEQAPYSNLELNMKSIVEENIELFAPMARAKQIQFVSSCPKDLTLFCNRDLLNIILSNLISNAVKYSFEKTTITINVTVEEGEIHLLVKNEGIGIEPEEIEKIFDEFYRTRKAREIEKDGTGLGLSIIKKAVNSMEGRITVYSEASKSTSFHIFLPLSETAPQQTSAQED